MRKLALIDRSMLKFMIPGIVLAAGALESAGAPTREEMRSVALQVPGRDFRTHPPKITSMHLFPNGAGSGGGTALLEAAISEELPAVLKFIWKDKVTLLRDDGSGGDRLAEDNIYSASVDVDLDGIMRSSSKSDARDLVELAAEARGGIPVPVYGKHVMTPEQSRGEFSPSMEKSLATMASAAGGDPLYIDPAKSLLIRDISVVNNSTRTQDPCLSSSPADADRKWTFGYLISQMADDPSLSGTQKTPSQFSIDWLSRWSSFGQAVNNYSMTSQPSISTRNTPATILSKWRVASGSPSTSGPVAMNKAPFRLLAIVNRLDLRHNLFFGEGLAGELRFVFAVLDNDTREWSGGPCSLLDIEPNPPIYPEARPSHTVILEYAVDKLSQQAVFEWAQQWQALSNMTMGSTEYLNALQVLTESVVTKGKGSTANGAPFNRPNRSALIRLRTNQNVNNTMWELREFEISNVSGSAYRHSPVPVTVKQTPNGIRDSHTYNKNQTFNLGKWIVDNLQSIELETHVVPNSFPSQGYQTPLWGFLGSRSVTQGGIDLDGLASSWDFLGYWIPSETSPAPGGWLDYNDPRHVQVRHLFSKNTCNGCHGAETRPPNVGNTNGVFHVKPRKYNEASLLSNFLTGLPMEANPPPDAFVMVPDPRVPSVERHFNDLERRMYDMATLLFYGPETMLSFQPTTRAH